MTHGRLWLLVGAMVAMGCATREAAPPAEAATGATGAGTLTNDLLADLTSVETKIVGLARAIPDAKYNWHPDSARTVRQVLLHVAADNYFMPAAIGFTPDPSTGIVGSDYKTGAAFEERSLPRDSVVAELERSFAFVKQSLTSTTPAQLTGPVTMFGESFTGQSAWLLAVTHVHEHLGQLIAYARTNGIKPPWS